MKTKILLIFSLLLNIVALSVFALYQYTPVFDLIVVEQSLPRLCAEAKNEGVALDPCQYLNPKVEAQPTASKKLYYIRDLKASDNQTRFELDAIQWLESAKGQCSNAAEVIAGIVQCNPNGFLIQNPDPTTTKHILADSFEIQLNTLKFTAENQTVTLDEFLKIKAEMRESFATTPFEIELIDQKITTIHQRYTP